MPARRIRVTRGGIGTNTMRILIVFATVAGHARTLAEFAAERLRQIGHEVGVCDAVQADPLDPAGFDRALLIASLHLGRFPPAFVAFARKHHAALNALPSALVCVSLSAAGDNAADRGGLRDCVERLQRDTQWHAAAVYHVAGAMLFRSYGRFTRLAIGFIARRRGMSVALGEDYDLTNYAAFAAFIEQFVSGPIAPAPTQAELAS